MIMQPLSGRVIDWLNTRRGFSLAVIWWSIANMLHAFARTPFTFGLFRGLLGIGEAGNFPGVAKTVSEWFPPKERSMATGIANTGSATGALIAMPLIAWIILKFGWQEAFVFTGAVGFIWVIVWLLLYQPPEKNRFITGEELDYIRKGQAELPVEELPQEKGVWKLILQQANFWGIAIPRFLAEPVWQFVSLWVPLYLMTQRGMDLKQIAMFAWIPFLAADLGCLCAGFFSMTYQKLGLGVLNARKATFTTAALIVPLFLFISKAPTAQWAIVWICCAAFGHSCLSSTALTMPADLFPRRTVATANGLTGSAALLGAMVFTFILGQLVKTVGYDPFFVVIALVDIIGAFIFCTFLHPPVAQKQLAA
jgi:ACS family hexuronate transporter-like MFS transporter